MNCWKNIYICTILLFCLAACSQEEHETPYAGSGFLLNLTDKDTPATRLTPAEVLLKEGGADLAACKELLKKKFNISITKQETGRVVYNNLYTEELIPASIGSYLIEASYGDNAVLGLDAPYYYGSNTEAQITEQDEVATVSVKCAVANALASIKLSDLQEGETETENRYTKLFSDFGLEATIIPTEESPIKSHVCYASHNFSESVYFRAGTVPTFKFRGTLRDTGREVTLDLAVPADFTAAAAQHLIFNISLKSADTSGVVVTLEKAAVETVTIENTIQMEWLPKPQVEAVGFEDELDDSATKLTFYETERSETKLNFLTPIGLEDVEFTINFADDTYKSLNGSYVLSQMTEEQKQAFYNAGIILPELGNANKATLDFTTLISYLRYPADATDTTKDSDNVITLTKVTANGKELDNPQSYTLAVKKAPVFTLSIDERNIWAKEFTLDESIDVTAGDPTFLTAAIANKSMVYQYSTDGGKTWVDQFNDNDNRRQDFKTIDSEYNADNTQGHISVRAKYRGHFYSEVLELDLEEQIQMPNSNMDSWSQLTYTAYETVTVIFGSYGKFTAYTFYPWNTTNGVSSFWDTINDFTTRHRNNVANTIAGYNGFHAVSPVKGRNGLAAEIRSTANGRANTRASSSSHTEQTYNKVAGELYTGTTSVTVGSNDANGENDTYTKTKDAEHPSRPTDLKFWYKYSPYGTDACYVTIELLDTNGTTIITQTLSGDVTVNDWTEVTVHLDYNQNTIYEKCKYIYIIFSSSTKSGNDLPYNKNGTHTFYALNNDGSLNNTGISFSPAYVGSILTIDDISLVYNK